MALFDAALADSVDGHARLVREWALQVWRAWAVHHAAVTAIVSRHLGIDVRKRRAG